MRKDVSASSLITAAANRKWERNKETKKVSQSVILLTAHSFLSSEQVSFVLWELVRLPSLVSLRGRDERRLQLLQRARETKPDTTRSFRTSFQTFISSNCFNPSFATLSFFSSFSPFLSLLESSLLVSLSLTPTHYYFPSLAEQRQGCSISRWCDVVFKPGTPRVHLCGTLFYNFPGRSPCSPRSWPFCTPDSPMTTPYARSPSPSRFLFPLIDLLSSVLPTLSSFSVTAMSQCTQRRPFQDSEELPSPTSTGSNAVIAGSDITPLAPFVFITAGTCSTGNNLQRGSEQPVESIMATL